LGESDANKVQTQFAAYKPAECQPGFLAAALNQHARVTTPLAEMHGNAS
jgi:hypothetical protein